MNKHSATPLYQQLVDSIKEQILSGKIKEGDKLMTEQEFSEAYNVSRITVRKAMEMLSDEGIVVKKQGIGTFVASKTESRNGERFEFYRELREGRSQGFR